MSSCVASLFLNLISTQPCRVSRPSRSIPTAAQRNQTVSPKPQQGSTGKRSGQVEIDEVPFFDRFHNSITGFPFPLGPFLQRRTIRKEVGSFTSTERIGSIPGYHCCCTCSTFVDITHPDRGGHAVNTPCHRVLNNQPSHV